MTYRHERLSKDTLDDFRRNREGRLSTRQWIALTTEPLTTLLLLSVPIILIFGRYGVAGRALALALIGGFALTIVLRAFRFARVKLCYRVLYSAESNSRWRFWRKPRFSDQFGETVPFDKGLVKATKAPRDRAFRVYFFELAKRRVLISLIDDSHPKADLAQPSEEFANRGGTLFAD